MVDVAGASLPDAPVMAEVGMDEGTETEASAAEVAAADVGAADEMATDWPGVEVTPPPRSREIKDCAFAVGAKRAAADSATTATMLLFIVRGI